MCGRFTQTAALDVLAERFGITLTEDDNEAIVARYNVAPSQLIPVVVDGREGRRIVLARWGFRPAWMSSAQLAPINARSETVATSAMFRDAVRRTRCLIPADGFYEWQARPGQKRKQPWYLRLRGGGVFGFAGLWTPGDPTADVPPSVTIVTTTPNAIAAPIHNRMPVILARDAEATWLDRTNTELGSVLRLLRPLPAELMEAYPVSAAVSSTQNDGPQLVERAPEGVTDSPQGQLL
jgi:putative SOS response-associated peptidase YedK